MIFVVKSCYVRVIVTGLQTCLKHTYDFCCQELLFTGHKTCLKCNYDMFRSKLLFKRYFFWTTNMLKTYLIFSNKSFENVTGKCHMFKTYFKMYRSKVL